MLATATKQCCTRDKFLNSERDMSWKLGLVVVVACFASTLTPASAQSFTLQQIMSGTFNSELQASPKGSRVVWMANQEGKRNVWIADLSTGNFAARQLTAYTADDGQDIGDITWTPDGQSVRLRARRRLRISRPSRSQPRPAHRRRRTDHLYRARRWRQPPQAGRRALPRSLTRRQNRRIP